MKFNLKINLKSILKYELITNKSFYSLDYYDEKDVLTFIYSIVISNNNVIMTFDEFNEIIKNKKLYNELIKQFEKLNNFNNQFNLISELDNNTTEENNKVIYFKDIISTLILKCNLSIDYVMNDMTIQEIEILLKKYDEVRKEELEEKRLFTYLTVLPQIDGRKFNSPAKFYPFFWEEEDIKKDTLENIEKNKEMLNEFMNEGMNFIFKNNKEKNNNE